MRHAVHVHALLLAAACRRDEPPRPPAEPGGSPQLGGIAGDPEDELLRVAGKPGAAPAEPPRPGLPWPERAALAIAALQRDDPARYERLRTLRPDARVGDEQLFSQPEVADPRAAAVLLQRLLAGDDPEPVRLALVDALPVTSGDWQEGAAALVAIDASPRVRKKLVEVLRYVAPPHNLVGLRHAFADEDLAVRVAAARTTGFTRDAAELYPELMSASFDEDWDMRAAAAQSLGQLGQRAAWGRLVALLGDAHPEVRLQALLALERIDPAGARGLAALEGLARDARSPKVARAAARLLAERPAAGAGPGGAAATNP
jgi:hypothetical protein